MDKKEKDQNLIWQLLKRKGLVAFASFGLLVSLIVMGTTAWYTKVNDVSGITLRVASFDFKADYTTNEFQLDAADFYGVSDHYCAPGTVGVIPVMLTAAGNTGVTYSLGINTDEMAEEFKGRIRYFYFDAAGNEITLNPGEKVSGTFMNANQTEYIYWEWVYELDANKFYDYNSDKWVINGKVNKVDENGNFSSLTPAGVSLYSLYVGDNSGIEGEYPKKYESLQDAKDAHDQFDYEIGTGVYDKVFTSAAFDDPDDKYIKTAKYMSKSSITYNADGTQKDVNYYQDTVSAIQFAMQAKLLITGVQADPTSLEETPAGGGTTTYKAISSFTSGVAFNSAQ